MATPPTAPRQDIGFRSATILSSDAADMATMAIYAYRDTPLTTFLNPYRDQHMSTCHRNFKYRIVSRMLTPRNVTLVAHPAGSPNIIIGYICFIRLGDNFPSAQTKGDWIPWILSVYWAVLSWMWKWYCKGVNYIRPDFSEDAANVQKFMSWVELDDAKYWDPVAFPERKERWHVQSMVVSPDWQRRGIGSRFMEDAIGRAREERICLGVEATTVGAYTYKKVGCVMLGEFSGDGIEKGGGVMIWRPEGWRGDEKEREEIGRK